MYISENTAIQFNKTSRTGIPEKRLVRFFRDEYPDDPRCFPEFATLALFTRYAIGDFKYCNEYPTPEHFWRRLVFENVSKDELKNCNIDDLSVGDCIRLMEEFMVCLPIWLIDHGTIQLRVSDKRPDIWDSSFAGWYVITRRQAEEYAGFKHWDDETKADLRDYMLNELETYNAFLVGDVWGYQLYTYEEDEKTWCKIGDEQFAEGGTGFYGSNLMKNGMLDDITGLKEAIESDTYKIVSATKRVHKYVSYDFGE